MSRIKRVEAFSLEIPRDKPYLGELRPGESINERGYFVRGGNRSCRHGEGSRPWCGG